MALDGFVGPAHVSTVIGTPPYECFATEFQKPVVIAGFEPLDVMQAILMLVRQVNEGRAEVENQYIRAVTADGNRQGAGGGRRDFRAARQLRMARPRRIPYSALRLREAYAPFDAERRFDDRHAAGAGQPGLRMRRDPARREEPADCKLFGTLCTPETPMGSCMVSSEGSCAAHWTYGRFRDRETGLNEWARHEQIRAARPQARSSPTAASISPTARAGAPWRS